MSRKALVHVGTHKTGTKTIQLFLNDNWVALRDAGFYIPEAGRVRFDDTHATPGHHDLVKALLGKHDSALDEFKAEVARENAPSIFISSEEFHPLAGSPHLLGNLRDIIASLEYEATVIIYLRPQADYAQSMYAELSKSHEAWRYPDFLREIIERGALYSDGGYQLIFEYSRLVRVLGDVFGDANVVVRKYDEGLAPSALVTDFMRVVSAVRGPIDATGLALASPQVNKRGTFAEVLGDLYEEAVRRNPTSLSTWAIAQRLGLDPSDARLSLPFAVMSHAERRAIIARFDDDNRLLEEMAGVKIVHRDIPLGDPSWETASFQRNVLDLALDIWFR